MMDIRRVMAHELPTQTYLAARQDWELYGPLTKHIVAFHDIYLHDGPMRLWAEVRRADAEPRRLMFLEFGAWHSPTARLGIGAAVRHE